MLLKGTWWKAWGSIPQEEMQTRLSVGDCNRLYFLSKWRLCSQPMFTHYRERGVRQWTGDRLIAAITAYDERDCLLRRHQSFKPWGNYAESREVSELGMQEWAAWIGLSDGPKTITAEETTEAGEFSAKREVKGRRLDFYFTDLFIRDLYNFQRSHGEWGLRVILR